MNLDRPMILAMGLAAAGLLSLGLTFRAERSPVPGHSVAAPPPAKRACLGVVAEHAACALPPRHEQQAERLHPSSPAR
jgi:hypothetical protein